MKKAKEYTKEYWNNYYSKPFDDILLTPSQFSVFVLSELTEKSFIIDMGCGAGRDTIFFSKSEHTAIGIDGSIAAIDLCNIQNKKLGISVPFLCESVSDQKLAEKINTLNKDNLNIVVYARFFLHAITEVDELAFFCLAKQLCTHGGILALEFRTSRDTYLKKETSTHFRRELNTFDILNKVIKHQFSLNYFVEGFGFAKYKNDDAYVARCIAKFNG